MPDHELEDLDGETGLGGLEPEESDSELDEEFHAGPEVRGKDAPLPITRPSHY